MDANTEVGKARLGRRIRMRDLQVFQTAARSGSMTQAAHHLSITQPAVSKAVRDLELTLGVRLLDRSPGGVASTAYGEVLARRAAAVFDELQQAEIEIQALRDPRTGRVRVGCNESLSVALLPAAIARMAEDRPGVTVSITQMSRPIDVEVHQLRERNVDLILTRGLFEVPEGDLAAEVLFEEPFVVVAGVASSWARRDQIELADLVGEKWILHPPEEAPGTVVLEAFRAHGLTPPRACVTTTSFHVRDTLMMSGDYLTVIPACVTAVFNAKAPTIKVLPVDLGIAPRPVAIFTLKNRTLNPVAARFAETLKIVTANRRSASI
jgi:DNA-binding transcriptional LysR family regulator